MQLPESARTRWNIAAVMLAGGVTFNVLVQGAMPGHATFQPYFTAVTLAAFWVGALPALFVLAGSCASAWWMWTTIPGIVADDQQPFFMVILAAGNLAGAAMGLIARAFVLARARAEQRLLLALQAGRMAAWDWDLLNDKVTFAPGAATVFGTTWEDSRIGAMLTHPDDAAHVRAAVSAALRGTAEYAISNRIIVHGSGEIRYLETRAHVERDRRGRATRVSGVTADVTDRQRENRRKDEFLTTLAHELRNPIAPIRNSLALFGDDAPLSVRRKAREVIERQCAHMSRLVDDLLDLSRISRHVVELRRQAMDLRQLARDALEAAAGTLAQAQLRVAHEEPAEPLWVDGDPTRLAQVIGNLLENAAKYTPSGGSVTLRLAPAGEMARIEVQDTGFGLTPDMRGEIFELFSQPHRSIKGERGGLGIGLSVVRQLVELHGGRIEVESAGLDKGSTFRVLLPLARASVRAEAPEAAASP